MSISDAKLTTDGRRICFNDRNNEDGTCRNKQEIGHSELFK